MDYPSTEGSDFYSPEAPKDQVAEQQQAKEATISALPIIEELINDFEEMVDFGKSIEGIKIGGGINTDAQILAKGHILAFAKEKLTHYQTLRDSVKPAEQEGVS